MDWECVVLQQDCPGCGICADVCLHDAILMTRQMAYPEPVAGQCIGCMICVAQCPFGAMEVKQSVCQ